MLLKSDEIEYTEATCPRPRRGTCVRYMFDKYGPDSVRDVANWCVWTMNSKLPFPENGTFDWDCLNHLRKVLVELPVWIPVCSLYSLEVCLQ